MTPKNKIVSGGLALLSLTIISILIFFHPTGRDQKFKHVTMEDLLRFYGRRLPAGRLHRHRVCLVVSLDPGCEMCDAELKDLGADTCLMKETNTVLISEGTQVVNGKYFQKVPGLIRSAVVIVDSLNGSYRIFGNHVLPSSYLFDQDGIMIKSWQGEVSAKAINHYLERLSKPPGR